ncbi:MAG: hypothetical protein ABR974_14200 [Bacteroidales bacterium]
MNTQEIYSLLEKYYDGRCSDEEEQMLRKYFRETEVPNELKAEKEMFAYYDSALSVPMPGADFEARIIRSVDTSEIKTHVLKTRRYLFMAMSSAAALLLLIGSWFFFVRRTEPADTFRDPSLAYNETIKILYDVSAKLNSGIDALEPARRAQSVAAKSLGTVKRSTGMINDNLKALDYFQKAMVIVSSPLEISTSKNKNP